MKVIILAPDIEIEASIRQISADAGYEADGIQSPQDMCSALYRDPETIGVIWSGSASFAGLTCRQWRLAGVKNLLFVLLEQGGLSSYAASAMRWPVLGDGADDVQPASIDPREYVARLHALVRRDRGEIDTSVKLPLGVVFDPISGSVIFPGGTVGLSQKEADILAFLASRSGAVVTKEMLLQHLYDGRDEPELKIIDVFVCKIRKKLAGALGGLDIIRTVWGRGYQFVPEGFEPILSDARTRRAG